MLNFDEKFLALFFSIRNSKITHRIMRSKAHLDDLGNSTIDRILLRCSHDMQYCRMFLQKVMIIIAVKSIRGNIPIIDDFNKKKKKKKNHLRANLTSFY